VPPPTEGRLSHDEAPLFWQAADALCGDPDIGLHLGEVMQSRLLDVVGYLLLASRDLQQALDSFLRFQHILAGGFVAQLRVEGERTCLVLDLNYRGFGPLRQQMECLALLFIKLLRLVTDDEFRITGLDFRHARPARVGEHRRLFGLLPNFAAAHDALWFPAALLRRPSRNANPGLHRLLWQHAQAQLAELVENDLLNRLSYLLGVRLGQADCSLRACADELGMTAAALQRGLAAMARQHGVWLVAGTIPLACPDPDRVFNTLLLYAPDGSVHGRYDKIHLFGFTGQGERYCESDSIVPGSEPLRVSTPLAELAFGICYDLRFPELFRRMAPFDLLILPAAFTATTGEAHWEVLLRARAIENQCYVLASAQGGSHENGRQTHGQSLLIDPWGKIVAQLDKGEGVVVAEIDPTLLQSVRSRLPALAHRVFS